jgi:hypothetical protein
MWWLFLLISIYIRIKMQRHHKWANMESLFVLKSKPIWTNFISRNVNLPWIYIFEPINQIKGWDIDFFCFICTISTWNNIAHQKKYCWQCSRRQHTFSNQNFGPSNNLSLFPKIIQKSFDDISILAFDSSSIGHLDFKTFST